MLQYEESKKKKEELKPAPPANAKPEAGATDVKGARPSTEPASEEPGAVEAMPETPAMGMGMGMMGGVMGRRPGAPAPPPPPKYEPTTWGRYAKVLLSSSEFTFIN